MVLTSALGGAGTKVGPLNVGPGTAQALSFTTRGKFIVVTVRNPLADPARYRAEFAAHHLNIKLEMLPVSPSLVGTIVFFDGGPQITPITATGKCWTGGGGSVCPVGARISLDFHGSAVLTFGRAARPGEQYASTTSATAPGEALHGLRFRGRAVTTVLRLLKARHVTVPEYRYVTGGVAYALRPYQVAGSWYVYDAVPWAPGQVLLWVGPRPRKP